MDGLEVPGIELRRLTIGDLATVAIAAQQVNDEGHGGITRFAKHRGIAPSTLSQVIKRVESALSCELFARGVGNDKTIRDLTPEGRAFIQHAKALSAFAQSIGSLRGGLPSIEKNNRAQDQKKLDDRRVFRRERLLKRASAKADKKFQQRLSSSGLVWGYDEAGQKLEDKDKKSK